MELSACEIRVQRLRHLEHLHDREFRMSPAEAQTRFVELRDILRLHFEAVAEALVQGATSRLASSR